MKLKHTGLYITAENSAILLSALSSTLKNYYDVKPLVCPCEENVCEVFLTPCSSNAAQFKRAKMLIEYSIKVLKKVKRRKKKDRKKFARKLLANLKRNINHFRKDLNSSSEYESICQNSDSESGRSNNRREILQNNQNINNQPLICSQRKDKKSVNKKCNEEGVESIKGCVKNTYVEKSDDQINNQTPNNSLKPVIIDGSNVAFSSHGKHKTFSFKGLEICINYFKNRGHKVTAILPNFRKAWVGELLNQWENDGTLLFTPSRKINGRNVVCQDDRFIIQCATQLKAVIVSLDQYRDFLGIDPMWDETIKERLLMFTWFGDHIMFPEDPLGPDGPSLDEFLRYYEHSKTNKDM